METNVFPQTQAGNKSYWSKPEGKIGIIFGLLMFGVIGYHVLPYLTTILDNWIHFSIVLGVFAALFYILVVDRRIYMAFKYMYDVFIKKTFGLVFKLDPFVIAEDYINDIKKERENLDHQIEIVSGQKEETTATIQQKTADRKHQLDIAATAYQKQMFPEMNVATAQAGRLQNFIDSLVPIQANLDKIEVYLEAVYKNSEYMLQDMINDLDIKKEQYKAVTKGNNALNSALRTMKGNPDKRILMENSMDYLREDMANKLANMKHAIKQSGEVMKTIDLNNATMETDGLRMLQEYKPELFTYDASQPSLNPVEASKSVSGTKYDNLLK